MDREELNRLLHDCEYFLNCKGEISLYNFVENLRTTYLEPREKRIAELEQQIEKMKCCYNCKQSQDETYCKIKKSDVNDLSCWDCGCDKWEIKEK